MIHMQVVHSSDGRIHYVVVADRPESFLSEVELGGLLASILQGVPDDFSVDSYYMSAEGLTQKQPLNLPESLQIAADGIDEAVISNIPAGVTVEWPDGEIDEVTDGEVRFAVDLPGTYTLTFDAVPYLRQEVAIEAVPAT